MDHDSRPLYFYGIWSFRYRIFCFVFIFEGFHHVPVNFVLFIPKKPLILI